MDNPIMYSNETFLRGFDTPKKRSYVRKDSGNTHDVKSASPMVSSHNGIFQDADRVLDMPFRSIPEIRSRAADEYQWDISSSSSSSTPMWGAGGVHASLAASQPWTQADPVKWGYESSNMDEEDANSSEWLDVLPPIETSRIKPDRALQPKRRKQSSSTSLVKRTDSGLHAFMGPNGVQAVNMSEFSLYEKSNKFFIVSGLRQIYDNSFENGMSLWAVEANCPFEKNSLWFKRSGTREYSSLLSPTSLHQRANQLDKALAPLREIPLTAAEEAGASRTLKLAIMAFASRWSHLSGASSNLYPACSPEKASNDNSDDTSKSEATEARELEILIQQSLYDSAMAALERWSYCDSFRVILAGLLIFFIKRPPDESELAEVQDLWQTFKSESRSPGGNSSTSSPEQAEPRPAPTEPPLKNPPTDRFATSQAFVQLVNSSTGRNFFSSALRHLLAWSPKVRAFAKESLVHCGNQATACPKHQTATRVSSDFNIIFWLGVMCDTASSSLDGRHLTISDHDAELQLYDRDISSTPADNNERLGSAINSPEGSSPGKHETDASTLWGSQLMPIRAPCDDPYLYEGPQFLQRAEKILQEASPLKILLLRRLCRLQTLMQEQAMACTLEQSISDALQVCTYWNTRFGTFFRKCISHHEQLPFKIRTWYVMLLSHWNLGYLHVANHIEQCDRAMTMSTMQGELRRSSCLCLQLQKEGSFAIADIARAASKDILTNGYDKTNMNVHSTCRDSSMLTDPCGDLMFLALSSACDTFLAWSQKLQLPPDVNDTQNIWLQHNLNVPDLLDRYKACMESLKIFGRQYDVASLTVKFYEEQLKLIGVNSLLGHRNYIRSTNS
jgi:hypothetical protein